MSDGTEVTESAEAVEQPNLASYAAERLKTTAKVAIIITTYALLFVVWILVAWGARFVAQLAKDNGFNEYFAEAYFWISSACTLLLALFYIVDDIIKEFRQMFLGRKKMSPQETRPQKG